MRKTGQSLIIGKDIEIQILDVQPHGVKIGVSAPREILILRKELLTEARLVNKESAVKDKKITLDKLKETFEKKD